MKHATCTIFLLLFTITLWAQTEVPIAADQDNLQKYAGVDFKDQFSVLVEKSGSNNIYLVDFSRLATRFERVYFMNLSFSTHRIVNIDPTVREDRVRFMSYEKNEPAAILKQMEEMRVKATQIAAAWTAEEKTNWLAKNDKYN
jgi:hypothetical protein